MFSRQNYIVSFMCYTNALLDLLDLSKKMWLHNQTGLSARRKGIFCFYEST